MRADVIRLTPGDTERYVELRREMLVTDPWAFASSPGDDPAGTAERVRAYLTDTPTKALYAAAEGDRLVAACGVIWSERAKMRHAAMIWGVYCRPGSRGKGHGRAVVAACVEHARGWEGVSLINLSVSRRSDPARAMYESLGFERWGTEPRATMIRGECADEHHMQLVLRGDGAP